MRKILQIARREYFEAIKTRTFIFSIIITPLLIFGMGFINSKMAKNLQNGSQPARRLAVVDLSRRIGPRFEAAVQNYSKNFPQRKFEARELTTSTARIEPLRKDVIDGRLEGLLVIARDADAETSQSAPKSQFYSRTKNISDLDTLSTIERLLNESVTAERYRRHNISPELIARLSRRAPLETIEVGPRATNKSSDKMAVIMIPFFFMFLMFMGIMGTSQGMLTTVVEEKSSRVIEVLLAAVSPQSLMAGKILGMTGVGLTMIAIWGLTAAGAVMYYGMHSLIGPGLLAAFVIWYVVGFIVIAALFAAVGSACNTVKEAQNLLGPITMLIVLPMIVWLPIAQNPNGTLALAFSYFPTTASMIMVLRLIADPSMPLISQLGPMAALIASGAVIVWLAGKIFRVGILMYGKPPTPRELLRWIWTR